MMADSIEHVISYWIIFQKFHSPALGGFAVLSHWLPFLFFSVYSGALADRFDPRRIIQIGMGMFMLASLAWGILFLTDTLQRWHAVVILTVHGFAGVAWAPSAQLLLHDIAGGQNLHSAVRGQGGPGFVSGPLLAATPPGALPAGIILESRGGFLMRPQLVFLSVMLWCACIAGFAASTSYPLSLLLLFCAGFTDMSYSSS